MMKTIIWRIEQLALSITWYLGESIENFFINKNQKLDLSKIRKIVVLHLSAGIGNAILLTPTLAAIRSNFPKINLMMIVSQKGAREIIEKSSLVNGVVIYGIQSSWLNKMKILLNLRKIKPDITINAFPSNWKSALIGRIIGSKYRVGHEYRVGYLKRCDFLYSVPVPFIEAKHEVEANLELTNVLGMEWTKKQPFITIPDADRQACRDLIIKWNISQKLPLIGFHCGSPSFKRWPEDRFADLGVEIKRRPSFFRIRLISLSRVIGSSKCSTTSQQVITSK